VTRLDEIQARQAFVGQDATEDIPPPAYSIADLVIKSKGYAIGNDW